MVAPYGIYDSGTKSAGGGVAALYKLNDYVAPCVRMDYLNNNLFMPSGNLTLQYPLPALGKFTLVPFAYGGLALPLAGKARDNGNLSVITGIGLALRISSHFDLITDWENWTGFKGDQYRFGVSPG